MCHALFDDKRVVACMIGMWTIASALVFSFIMLEDGSPFLSFGPNDRTALMGVNLDTWGKWWCVAVYTFLSTCVAAFSSDAVVPWITNTIQDHKTMYIPYNKVTCLLIIQVFTIYAVVVGVIGMFVALTQIDFMLIRICADLLVNYYTTYLFMRNKTVNPTRYKEWLRSNSQAHTPPPTHSELSECVLKECAPDMEECVGAERESRTLLARAPPSD